MKYYVEKLNKRSKLFDSQFKGNPQYLVRDSNSQIVKHFKGPTAKFDADYYVRDDKNGERKDMSNVKDKIFWVINYEHGSEKIMTKRELDTLVGKSQARSIIDEQDEFFSVIQLN